MNQIQFETSKVFGVFVKDITPEFTDLHPQYSHYLNQGSVSNLTDEQKEGVVDKSKFYNIYLDYVKGAYVEHLSLQKSFASLLTSLNVLLVNPYGENEPKESDYFGAYGEEEHDTQYQNEKYSKAVYNWQTAEQHVGQWCLLTCDK